MHTPTRQNVHTICNEDFIQRNIRPPVPKITERYFKECHKCSSETRRGFILLVFRVKRRNSWAIPRFFCLLRFLKTPTNTYLFAFSCQACRVISLLECLLKKWCTSWTLIFKPTHIFIIFVIPQQSWIRVSICYTISV